MFSPLQLSNDPINGPILDTTDQAMRPSLHGAILRCTAALGQLSFLKQQCRAMTLCMALNPKRKFIPGIEKVADFQSCEFPNPSSYTLEIWQDEPRRSLGTKDLASALREHGGAGLVLHQIDHWKSTKSPGTELGEYDHKSAEGRSSIHDAQQSKEEPTTNTQDVPRFILKPLALKEDSEKQTPGMYKKLRFYGPVANTPGYAAKMAKASELLTKHMAVEFIISGPITETLNTLVRRYPQLHCDSILAALPTGCYFVVQPQMRFGVIHFLVGPPGKNVFSEDGKPHDLTSKIHEIGRTARNRVAEKKKNSPRTGPSRISNTRSSKYGEEGAVARNTGQGRGHGTKSDYGKFPGVQTWRLNRPSTSRQRGGDSKTRHVRVSGNDSSKFDPKQWEVQMPSYNSPKTSRLSPDESRNRFSGKARLVYHTCRDRAQRDGFEKVPRKLKIRLIGTTDPNYRPFPKEDYAHP
ncbi:hypothetical protein BDZ45DRAFT_220472 [Acephala macrosclerotiorum]|nr:hypothetical protein BDZ45DRAFT_220472 [Acephala macrosclerotiorum]